MIWDAKFYNSLLIILEIFNNAMVYFIIFLTQ